MPPNGITHTMGAYIKKWYGTIQGGKVKQQKRDDAAAVREHTTTRFSPSQGTGTSTGTTDHRIPDLTITSHWVLATTGLGPSKGKGKGRSSIRKGKRGADVKCPSVQEPFDEVV
jgi:hypothetical protein